MKFIEQLKSLFPHKQIDVDKSRNSITVKNIDNSLVYINPLDQDDLAQLRADIHADQQAQFDDLMHQLIVAFNQANTPKIKHFLRIEELKTMTPQHRFLFDNELTYFTPEEIESHHEIIDHLETDNTALLLGYPATGKSISVVDIAEKLALKGYKTYYFSFKKLQHWPEIWEELKNHADSKTIFVLDDIHLQPETAGTTLNRVQHENNLNVLFISREVYQNRNFLDTLNIYEELKSNTVRTEQPSIDEKVKGIVQLYQKYYQKEQPNAFPIGDFRQIIKQAHRNLIVLNAYLNLWKKYPDTPLADLQEATLYRDIYATYFEQTHLDEDSRIPLLQYLCLYYFEVEFFRNPNEKAATNRLLQQATIIKEDNDRYSIYHGEYAFLLLKAYRFVRTKRFKRRGGTWQDFFFYQIKTYILGFENDPNSGYPDNLLEICSAIPMFTKEVQGGLKDTKKLFTRLVEDEEIFPFLINACEEEEDEKFIAFFLFSVIRNVPDKFEIFYKAFGNRVFINKYGFSIYLSAYKKLEPTQQHDWLEDYCTPHFSIMIESSPINRFAQVLYLFSKSYAKIAKNILSQVDNIVLIRKCGSAKINIIGNALNELKNIDWQKIKEIFEVIDNQILIETAKNARISEIGNALSIFKNINLQKTREIFKVIDNQTLTEIAKNARIGEIGNALNTIKNFDLQRAKEILKAIDNQTLIEIAKNARIGEIGNSLNELKNIDLQKTKEIFNAIDNQTLIKIVKKAKINKIGKALNELKNIDLQKTREIFNAIDNQTFIEIVKIAKINEIGNALNELKNIDLQKTKDIFNAIDNQTLIEIVKNVRIHEIGAALNQLKNIDLQKTKEIFNAIDNQTLIEIVKNVRIHEIGNALNELKNIDLQKTKDIFNAIHNQIFIEIVKNAKINEIGKALNELKNIDLQKTKDIFNAIDNQTFIEIVKIAKINEIGKALNELKNIDLQKTISICLASKSNILDKILQSNLSFRVFISQLNSFSRIAPQIGQEIYSSIPKSKIFQYEKLTNIYAFNLLALFLINIQLNKKDENFKTLINFGLAKSYRFLRYSKIHVVGNYIGVMSKLKRNIAKSIKENIPRYVQQLSLANNQRYAPRFIAYVYQQSPQLAQKQLLKPLQANQPEDLSISAKTYFEIAKVSLSMEQSSNAIAFLQKAKDLAEKMEADELLAEIQAFSEEIK